MIDILMNALMVLMMGAGAAGMWLLVVFGVMLLWNEWNEWKDRN